MLGELLLMGKASNKIRIAIDLLGSDRDPAELSQAIPALLDLLPERVHFVVFCPKNLVDTLSPLPRVDIELSPEVIEMGEEPLAAIRAKKESSICRGISMLGEKQVDAFVSAGNTGALFGAAKTTLSTLPGIDRPALLALLPTESHPMAVLDVGANTTVKASHLFQFAQMGLAYQKCRGVEKPTCGLLNIGTEATKGSPVMQEAYTMLQKLNEKEKVFIGNVEGRAAFQGTFDVLVTDGFTGNVFLKTAEGISSFLLQQILEVTDEKCSSELKLILSDLHHRLHYSQYPGAILCGIDGIVIKCHGESSPEALLSAVKGAYRLVDHGYLEKIRTELS